MDKPNKTPLRVYSFRGEAELGAAIDEQCQILCDALGWQPIPRSAYLRLAAHEFGSLFERWASERTAAGWTPPKDQAPAEASTPIIEKKDAVNDPATELDREKETNR